MIIVVANKKLYIPCILPLKSVSDSVGKSQQSYQDFKNSKLNLANHI